MLIERLFVHILEGFFMVGAGLGSLGIRPAFKQIALIACIYGMLVYAVRMFYTLNNIPFGTHTFILAIFFILLLTVLGKQTLMHSIISCLICLFLLYLGENILLLPIVNLLKLNIASTLGHPGGWFLLGLLVDIPLIIIFVLCYILKISIIKVNYFTNF